MFYINTQSAILFPPKHTTKVYSNLKYKGPVKNLHLVLYYSYLTMDTQSQTEYNICIYEMTCSLVKYLEDA